VALTTIDQVSARLCGARRVALGGMLLENRPSALVRALLRAGTRNLFLCSAPAASWDADVLIGAGRVNVVRIPHISLACVGLAPATRLAFEAGTVTFEDCDEALLLGGYLAAIHDSEIQALGNLGVNDVTDDNPLVVHRGALVGVQPLRVDVALLHAPIGDAAGNLVHFGSRWADLLIARSASHVVAQVDRLVSTAEARRLGVSIPAYLVDDVVELPFGAHPLGSAGAYTADLRHLASYRDRVAGGDLGGYLVEFCDVRHDDYVRQVGHERLDELVQAAK
jgi:glutaconate CoA-transferase, subunit A